MSMSGYTCVRYIFCFLNLTLWLSGCGLVGVGIWLKAMEEEDEAAYSRAVLLPQYSMMRLESLIITVGVILFVVAFFGCCGSWFQSRCMLVTYFTLVIVMFLLEFLVASLAFVYRQDLSETLRGELMDGIKEHYGNPTNNGIQQIWDHVHARFACCGVNNYQDWYDIKAWPEKKIVPASCCQPKYQNNTDCWSEGNQDYWYNKGCSEEVQMWFVSQLHIVGVVGLVVSFIQLFGLISAMLLFCTVGGGGRHNRFASMKDSRRGKYTAYSPPTV